MSASRAIPTITEFLTTGLQPHTPQDLDTDCTICTTPWRNDPNAIISLPCNHIFHLDCITQWLSTPDISSTATCPYCRHELCTRAPPQPYQTFWFPIEDEIASASASPPSLTPDPSWANLDTAIQSAREDLSTIYTLTYCLWCENDNLAWGALIAKILAAYEAGAMREIARGSAAEYVIVKGIVEALRECLWDEGLDAEVLERVLDGFEECEEDMGACSVEDAYLAGGLVVLVGA